MKVIKLSKSFKDRAKKYIPFWVQIQLYKIVKKARLLKNTFSKKRITKKHIKKFFRNIGLKKNDIILLHSSLGRIGYVENGSDAVIDAILEIIGKNGLLVMPGFSPLKYSSKFRMYEFNAQKTPSYTGAIPETFRKRNGVKRSLSPTHSLCALGRKAGELVKGHEKCDNPFAMNGPFGRLYRWNAKIFLLGVDHHANSSLHIVEDYPDFPVKVFTPRFKVLVDNKGKKKVILARRHTDYSRKIRNPNLMEKYCHKYKLIKICKIGNTELRVISIKPFVDMMKKLSEKNITIYPPR